jgi:hypothetical protein
MDAVDANLGFIPGEEYPYQEPCKDCDNQACQFAIFKFS